MLVFLFLFHCYYRNVSVFHLIAQPFFVKLDRYPDMFWQTEGLSWLASFAGANQDPYTNQNPSSLGLLLRIAVDWEEKYSRHKLDQNKAMLQSQPAIK